MIIWDEMSPTVAACTSVSHICTLSDSGQIHVKCLFSVLSNYLVSLREYNGKVPVISFGIFYLLLDRSYYVYIAYGLIKLLGLELQLIFKLEQ